MLAIISDVHANCEALEAVLAKIDDLGADRIICLGDIVGYGPEPVRCLDIVRERCDVVLCGNHDYAVVYGAEDFNPVARACIECHREQLMPAPDDPPHCEARRRWKFLKNLPHRHVEGEYLFVHAAPRNPVFEYLRKIDVQMQLEGKLRENFQQVEQLCFIGHTHRAGVITSDMEWLEPNEFPDGFKPEFHQKAIVNVGSVGQPRDRDSRSSFATLDEDEGLVRWHRVEYDVEAVARRIRENLRMDPSLAERLLEGR